MPDVAALIRGKDVKLEFDLVPIEKPLAGTTGNFLVVKNRGRDIESVEVIKDEAPTDTPRTLSPCKQLRLLGLLELADMLLLRFSSRKHARREPHPYVEEEGQA